MSFEIILASCLGLGLMVYLLFALLNPERFG
ncbi:MAG: K(+)-transporting ATPase subunit F [Candidatus Eremiobacteraeota bacterium]|nr:K(+)-transporting ATPase subunit F [Candidatus Eremiobacteraeota bacterium]MCW5872684.1 K(+)-transporting ATPase subunit F [Candidatus Eremiobacteraeota bacterium]